MHKPRTILLLLLLLASPFAPAQTLAHPHWKGSGFNSDPWFHRAVFYQVSGAAVDFTTLAGKLDAVKRTGFDAVIVAPPALPALAGATADQAFAAQASLDAFDTFTRQATARGIRVLVALQANRVDADLNARARFWLSRGVSGLRLEIPPAVSPPDRDAIAASVRSVAGSFTGQRVVLVDGGSTADSAAAPKPSATSHRTAASRTASAADLQVEPLLASASAPDAATLRPLIAAYLTHPAILVDAYAHAPSSPLTHVFSAIALTTGPNALIDPAEPLIFADNAPPAPLPADDSIKPAAPPTPLQPPPGVYLPYVPYVPPAAPRPPAAPPKPEPPDPLTDWYSQLIALHSSNAALRTGNRIFLDYDAQNALVWVARPASPTPQNPPVVVVCNLSSAPIQLSLEDAVRKLNLHGFFLRPLLRSYDAMGAQDLSAVSIPPFGVYIGELRR